MTKKDKDNPDYISIVLCSKGLGAIGNIAEAWAGKDKERAKKAFKIQKAINIATATIDTYLELRCARPMPVYSVPGQVDHF